MPRTYNKTGKFSMHSSKLICEICKKEVKNLRSLEVHLRRAHNFCHDISLYENYYNKYLKTPDEGICPVCGAPTKQHKFKYDKCCCISHAAILSQSNRECVKNLTRKSSNDVIFAKQIKEGLHIDFKIDDIAKEFEWFKSHPGDIHAHPNKNKLLLYFQQENFYYKEIEQFSNNKELRDKLIDNRVKYLFKDAKDLTDAELLRGFKISHLGGNAYSHFSPLWTKYFAEKYDLKYVADPFGGWGHHMIGFAAAGIKYVYNDLSHNTVEGVRKINDFLGTEYTIIEGNARDFIIPLKCDGVFMCPPYYNVEVYECGAFESLEEYEKLMLAVFDNCKSSNVRVIGIMIREDFEYLLKQGLGEWTSKEEVNVGLSHFNKNGKVKEYLYCYEFDRI